jgi:hypothetical protein
MAFFVKSGVIMLPRRIRCDPLGHSPRDGKGDGLAEFRRAQDRCFAHRQHGGSPKR